VIGSTTWPASWRTASFSRSRSNALRPRWWLQLSSSHDELRRAPESIDLVALHHDVQLRPRDPVFVAEVEEVALPVGVDPWRLSIQVTQGGPERLNPMATMAARE
jgi:hypothetical protein